MAVQSSISISSRFLFPALLTLLAFALHASTCHGARPDPRGTISLDFIRSSCNKTDYPSLCFNSLATYAPTIQTSPVQLASAALSVSLTNARDTSNMMVTLSKGKGMSSGEAEAMSDCIENLNDSVDNLQQSLQAMRHLRGKNLKLQVNDIQTWVSSALTDESTCMDGIASNGMKATEKSAIRSHVVKVSQLICNALSLVKGLAAVGNYSP